MKAAVVFLLLLNSTMVGGQVLSPALPEAYRWLGDTCGCTIENSIAVPEGYSRVPVEPGSFGEWLRGLPLFEGKPPVHLFNGEFKENQKAHFAVINIDVGKTNLQQCADAVIRLRSEFLYAGNRGQQIAFRFTSGDRAAWSDWRDGLRPTIRRNRVTWNRTASPDTGYRSFRRYLDTVFMYAGTASLDRELKSVAVESPIEIGDVFIRGGSPGHAVIVADAAEDSTGQRIFLLAQSFMPAQDIHILKSPTPSLNPWYLEQHDRMLETPEWDFSFSERKRFGE